MIFFLLACAGSDLPGGQSGEENLGCLPQAETPLALDETTTLGVTGSVLVALGEGSHADTFTWADGATSPVTVDVTIDTGSLVWVDYEMEDDGSGMELAWSCADQVEMSADLALSTEDGGLAEDFALRLMADVADTLRWSAQLGLEDLGGSYDASEIDTSAYNDGVFINFSGTFTDGAMAGAVEGQGTGHSGSGDDGVAFAEVFDVGTYGVQAEE